MRLFLLCWLALMGVHSALAQAQPNCPVKPRTVAAMGGCYRPLLVFAPTGQDRRLAAQRESLDAAADDMMDRFVLLVPIPAKASGFKAPLDAPYAILAETELAELRKRFTIPEDSFRVVLLGEDGGVKLRSSQPVSVDRLNGLIDTMPTRKVEMQRPHAN